MTIKLNFSIKAALGGCVSCDGARLVLFCFPVSVGGATCSSRGSGGFRGVMEGRCSLPHPGEVPKSWMPLARGAPHTHPAAPPRWGPLPGLCPRDLAKNPLLSLDFSSLADSGEARHPWRGSQALRGATVGARAGCRAAARRGSPVRAPSASRGCMDRHGWATVSPWSASPKPDKDTLGVWKRRAAGNRERRKSYEQKEKIIRKSNRKI